MTDRQLDPPESDPIYCVCCGGELCNCGSCHNEECEIFHVVEAWCSDIEPWEDGE